GAEMPFTVAEMPPMVYGSGTVRAWLCTPLNPAPNTLTSMPGAYTGSNEAAFTTDWIWFADAPTTNRTGTRIDWGNAPSASIATFAWYAPAESPAPDACTVTSPDPLPESGVTFSHFVVAFSGVTETRHELAGAPTDTAIDAVESCCASGTLNSRSS